MKVSVHTCGCVSMRGRTSESTYVVALACVQVSTAVLVSRPSAPWVFLGRDAARPWARPRGHSPDEVLNGGHTLSIHLHGDPTARFHRPWASGLVDRISFVGVMASSPLLTHLHPDEQVTALLALKDLL